MSGNKKQPLVPRLRFPEFKNTAEWQSPTLGEVSEPVEERVGERKLTPVSISAGIGFVPQAEKFGRDISGSQYKLYTVVRDGDFVYNKGNSLKFPQGCVYDLQGWGEVAAPNVFICFRLKNGYENGFYRQCFERNVHGIQLRKHITSGARSNGLLNISKEAFYGVAIPVPSHAEQQKIADCLSSLDDLIAAETQKLDTLKTHKKGLMQQLFPREGEAVPRLRFPEFREAGEWATKTLAELAENLDNRRVPVTEKDRTKGNIPYYGASGIVDYIRDFIFDEDLLCISEDGANLRARTAPIAFSISGKTWVNNHAHVLRFDSKCVQKIVEDYLNSISLEDYLTGMAQPKLNRAMLDTIPVPVPQDDDEQQAVSDCLSSLDDLITAQSQKIDAIKIHKKGLIQQLFPVLDEVPA
ncbi:MULTISPECIES: restriction endonuclease subunit S [Gammaproteobacteria]|uniref:Restriction endonuclease subunit S n=6 Tax=Gammaproteobacteria TaxID=1236 RepID=A0A5F0K837_9GAMM|nr:MULTISPECIES: restriction endonuclease subunit S [Gammaproteobacteria]AVZ78461.1 restriction endonuclease subunit S [Zoogloeaceae bacteirum Par-f-2]AUT41623.1 restriction endonuclease subunit S [Aeromonas sp. ASNIH5]EIU1654317.1 restriction endonuclease subunit S [Pseudomonas aeruginosa]EIU5324822.1 restriction endonuclease subunit S [Pseudomonas aeruginosa]EKA8143316.1 restriction endonuclease subunit S [Pseudomonas aeruginosa]